MCRAITCKQCNKPTWAGCGAHVEQVLGHVAPEDRCSCASKSSRAASSPAVPTTGWIRRFTRR